jgi:hypothetical protein
MSALRRRLHRRAVAAWGKARRGLTCAWTAVLSQHGRRRWRADGTARCGRRRGTRGSAATYMGRRWRGSPRSGRRENAAARHTYRCVGRGKWRRRRRRRRGVLGHVVGGTRCEASGQAVGAALSERGHGRRRGREAVAIGTLVRGPDSAFKARRGTGTWQPCGEGALIGGPGAERGRMTGGSSVSVIFELKFTPGRK